MKLTFSKTLLATVVMLGLTACSSGSGGNGSNEATTTPKNNNQVTIIREQVHQIILHLQTNKTQINLKNLLIFQL